MERRAFGSITKIKCLRAIRDLNSASLPTVLLLLHS
jgi:hypothetical protein